mmetsp:Transcript_19012/g.44118  ORF Transcript_19012/g.44118 Transcript_19012/m.44118 type:complete len:369 (+) Transcript_19012:629-1735(+)
MITGSSAAGEPIPPHFQFPTKAKDDTNKKIKAEAIKHLKDVFGVFGSGSKQKWGCTYAMNEKGGMNNEEFQKYVEKNIVRLFPDSADLPGKRVILKVDSGPGRNNVHLLARLRAIGIYVYPCVPNTTAITQETDQSYGYFKSLFRQNLKQVTNDRLARNKSINYVPAEVGFFVFGGKDRATGISNYKDAFGLAFTKEKNLAAWASVGAAPVTRRCLESDKVIHNTKGDPLRQLYENIEASNRLACDLLSSRGYNGNKLKVKLMKAAIAPPVTAEHSKERLEEIMKAKSLGQAFVALGSSHHCSEDYFKAALVKGKRDKSASLKKEKASRLAAEKLEGEALAILESLEERAQNKKKLKVIELQKLMLFF